MKANQMVVRNAAEGIQVVIEFMHNAKLVTSECIHEMMVLTANGYELPAELTTVQQIHKLYEAMIAELGDDGVCTNLEGISVEAQDTADGITNEDAQTMLKAAQEVTKTSEDGYVTKEALATMLKNLTGEVYGLKNKKHTRDFLIQRLDEYCKSHPIETAIVPAEPAAESETVNEPVTVVDDVWNKNNATTIINRVLAQSLTNKRQDVISKHMLMSFILEMLYGKRLTEYVDGKKIVNFSPVKTPVEWATADRFYCNFRDRYLHADAQSDKVYVVNSEIIAWKYRNARYAIDVVRPDGGKSRVFYDIDNATKTLVRLDNGHIFDLTPDALKKLDRTCALYKIGR